MAATPNTTINTSTIPEALRRLPQWLLWSGNKVPCTVEQPGIASSWSNPGSWSSFEAATITQRVNDAALGVGFFLPKEVSELGTLDLDGCRDPETGRWQTGR